MTAPVALPASAPAVSAGQTAGRRATTPAGAAAFAAALHDASAPRRPGDRTERAHAAMPAMADAQRQGSDAASSPAGAPTTDGAPAAGAAAATAGGAGAQEPTPEATPAISGTNTSLPVVTVDATADVRAEAAAVGVPAGAVSGLAASGVAAAGASSAPAQFTGTRLAEPTNSGAPRPAPVGARSGRDAVSPAMATSTTLTPVLGGTSIASSRAVATAGQAGAPQPAGRAGDTGVQPAVVLAPAPAATGTAPTATGGSAVDSLQPATATPSAAGLVAPQPAGAVPAAATAAATAAAPVPSTPTSTAPLAAQLSGPIVALARRGPGEHVATVRVAPESLGPVSIRAVVAADGRVHVVLDAHTEAGRESLRQVLGELRRDGAAAGMAATLELASRDSRSGVVASSAGTNGAGANNTGANGTGTSGTGTSTNGTGTDSGSGADTGDRAADQGRDPFRDEGASALPARSGAAPSAPSALHPAIGDVALDVIA